MREGNQELFRDLENNPYIRRDLEMMEEQIKSNELGNDLEKTKELILKAKVDNGTILLKLIDNINQAAIRYITAIIESFKVADRRDIVFNISEEKYGKLINTKDQEQRRAHDSLIDSIHILFRNCIKNNIEGIENIAKKYTEKKENPLFRDKMQKLAIFHVWSIMREEKQNSNLT